MTFWCRIGFHDWETVRSECKSKIRYDAERLFARLEHAPRNSKIPDPPAQPPAMMASTVHNRVCLTCGVDDFQIDRYRAECVRECKRRKARQERAAEIVRGSNGD